MGDGESRPFESFLTSRIVGESNDENGRTLSERMWIETCYDRLGDCSEGSVL